MIKLESFSSFFIANWKLNGNYEFIDQFISNLKIPEEGSKCVTLCPTNIYLDYMSKKKNNFFLGAQNVSQFKEGSFTGEISSRALDELNIDFCILGHSERRQFFYETNEDINTKTLNLIEDNIVPIICIGETLEEKQRGETNEVLKKQIEASISNISNSSNTVIAYEPVWAIGTGLTPAFDEIDKTHQFIRKLDIKFNNYKIIYGGSVKSSNVKEMLALPNIDGALIGGASLKYEEFNKIIQD